MTDIISAKEGVLYAMEHYGVSSYTALAELLSDDTLTVQPIQILNYVNGKNMSVRVATRFFLLFDVIIEYYDGTGRKRGQ